MSVCNAENIARLTYNSNDVVFALLALTIVGIVLLVRNAMADTSEAHCVARSGGGTAAGGGPAYDVGADDSWLRR